MARHTPDVSTTAPAIQPVRRRSRGRFVLGLFAIVASAGIALVTVTDPYAGARADPFYQQPVLVKASGIQRYKIAGGYVDINIDRDSFKVVNAPQQAPITVTSSSSGSRSSSGGSSAPAPSYTTPIGTAQTFAARAVAGRGWAPSEFSCLVNLWNRESGWSTHAANPSGAYGIPQALPGSKMATAGPDWQNNYQTQITWGLGYISGSYGSPCGAWAHSNAYGWY
ncbi:lytic transglycosylase domain-containing protein [Amnibacterium sp.]|uniref:aggregation-promoting factor C-terminal-like domain-containing protein n=1 Tax=Amnibacterium sp. TaxID=1872496 RepID=UPI003F7CBA3D